MQCACVDQRYPAWTQMIPNLGKPGGAMSMPSRDALQLVAHPWIAVHRCVHGIHLIRVCESQPQSDGPIFSIIAPPNGDVFFTLARDLGAQRQDVAHEWPLVVTYHLNVQLARILLDVLESTRSIEIGECKAWSQCCTCGKTWGRPQSVRAPLVLRKAWHAGLRYKRCTWQHHESDEHHERGSTR